MSTKKVKILVAEDDAVVAKHLSITLSEKGYEIPAIYESGEELIEKVQTVNPDLIILDINLAGNLDGIDVASQIKNKEIPFLYLTSDRDRMTLERAKLTQPYGYLIKPFDSDELVSAIELALYNATVNKAVFNINKQEAVLHDSYLFVKDKNRLVKVKYEEILFIEANDIYASLKTTSHTYILSYPLKSLEEKLPTDKLMRVHRSYIANLDHIEAIEDNYLLIDQKNIPIGKTYKDELMRRLSII